ncbi:hypothetical protein R2R70_23580, partial [Cobetia sp. SIMBA_158]|uniref:hypothetical protein n=1 Tax=Cobetia sp. SIMBA_158 TaxID=3081617 RepID=UPI00397F8EB4
LLHYLDQGLEVTEGFLGIEVVVEMLDGRIGIAQAVARTTHQETRHSSGHWVATEPGGGRGIRHGGNRILMVCQSQL